MNEVQSAILARRSTRGFNDTQLTETELQTLIDAALASPTAVNSQLWHFSVVQNKNLLDEMNADLAEIINAKRPEGSRGRFNESSFHVFYHAPTVIFISRPTECANRFVEVDCGIAVQNLALSAQGLGMGSVIIGMIKDLFDSEKGDSYAKAIGLPEGYQFSIAIAIGHNTVTKTAHPIGEGKVNIVE